MSAGSKPDPCLDPGTAAELIAEAEAADLLRARTAIARGVQVAREEWIPVHLIGDALAQELLTLARTTVPPMRVAAYLRALADAIGVDAGHGPMH